jgi:hypothetical protein
MPRIGLALRFERTALLALLFALGCSGRSTDSSLSKTEDDRAIPNVPPPPENGPKLGVIANITPILERPASSARQLGSLHAGALVARSAAQVRKTKDCDAGYYAIFPRGFVCLNQGATLELAHPTLAAMAIQPARDQALPYTYGRARVDSALFERDAGHDDAVHEVQKLPRGSAMAVVGSWQARVGEGEAERLGLLTNGRFARARDLEAVRGSNFSGYELGEGKELPVGFVLKRGVSLFKPDGDHFSKADPLDYHTTLPLSGRFRTVSGTKLWASENERWVRDQDATIVHKRTRFPDFVKDGQRWLDISVILGTLVAYEGKKPIFVTLVSTGRDRLGDFSGNDGQNAVTKLGTFEVVAKHVTLLGAAAERAGERYALFDLPWVLELSSGQLLHASYWHDRFGIEHGPGDVTLAPEDAHRVFEWATPALPKAWHSVVAEASDKTIVLVHK